VAESLFCKPFNALCDFDFGECERCPVFDIVSRCERPGETVNASSEKP
jgi:hypothetical protein